MLSAAVRQGLELEALKIAARLLVMLWKTSARTFWRSPPQTEHRWYQQLMCCCCCRSTGHFWEDCLHEFDDEDDRHLRGDYRCLRNKREMTDIWGTNGSWREETTDAHKETTNVWKMSGSQQKEGTVGIPTPAPLASCLFVMIMSGHTLWEQPHNLQK